MALRRTSKEFVFRRDEPALRLDFQPSVDAESLFTDRKISLADRFVQNITVAGSASTTLHMEACILERANFANSKFDSLNLKDVRLLNCDFANLETRGLTLIRVEFIDCRMTGLRAGKADFEHVLFSNGDQRYSQFRYSQFRMTEFDACNFAEADFYGTDLTGTRFRNCNLQRAEMHKVKLADADLRGSQVEGLQLTAEDIRGATVDLSQAMLFAPLLGIRIK